MPVVQQLVGVAKIKYDRSGLIQALRGMKAFEKRAKAMADRVQRSFNNATKLRADRKGLANMSKAFRAIEKRSKKTGAVVKRNLSKGFAVRGPRGGGSGGGRRGGKKRGGGGLGNGLKLGAGFIGITTAVQGIKSLITGAVRFNSEMQRTKIALTTVVSAVDKVSFEDAKKTSDELFVKVQKDAIRSTATTGELFRVVQGIAGPLRGAGKEYANIRDTALDTVNAAQVLNIDLPQAARDIKQITTGRAGVDVRLFSELKAMNLITEDAKEFNQLKPEERVNKIQKALKEAAKGAPAFARSWAGITSTLEDIFQILLNKIAAPVLESITEGLAKLAEFLIDNQKKIGLFFTDIGKKIGVFVEAFSEVISKKSTWIAALVAISIPLAVLAAKAAVAAAPFIALGVALAGVWLIAEDLATAFQGGNSAIGQMLDRSLGVGTTQRLVMGLKDAFNELSIALEPIGDIMDGLFGTANEERFSLLRTTFQIIGLVIQKMTSDLRAASLVAGTFFTAVRDAGRSLGIVEKDGATRTISKGGGGKLPTGGGGGVTNVVVNKQGDKYEVNAASAQAKEVVSELQGANKQAQARELRTLQLQLGASGGKA